MTGQTPWGSENIVALLLSLLHNLFAFIVRQKTFLVQIDKIQTSKIVIIADIYLSHLHDNTSFWIVHTLPHTHTHPDPTNEPTVTSWTRQIFPLVGVNKRLLSAIYQNHFQNISGDRDNYCTKSHCLCLYMHTCLAF